MSSFDNGLEWIARRLEDAGNSTEDEKIPPKDSQIVASTLRTYGTLYLVLVLVFSIMRIKFKKSYNVRAWSPHIGSDLAARDHFGYISWIWKVWSVSDDDFRRNCGMDALAFIRIWKFGLKTVLVGCLNAIWLMPVYGTSAIVEGQNDHIKDPFARLTIGYVPAGSPRFLATVFAAYINFFYVMWLLLKEFNWFSEQRHKFLSEKEVQNYTIYVTHIPPELRSSAELMDYFRQCFGHDAVLEAHVALKIPKLDATVADRDDIVAKLEHAINVEEILGKKPTHRNLLDGNRKVDSIETWSEELQEINEEVREQISYIEQMHDPMSFRLDLEARGVAMEYSPGKAHSVSSVNPGGSVAEQSALTFDDQTIERFDPALQEIEEVPGQDDGVDETSTLGGGPPNNDPPKDTRASLKDTSAHSKMFGRISSITNVAGNVVGGVAGNVAGGVGNVAGGMVDLGSSLLKAKEDGEPFESGFVTFTSLKVTQAALQQIQHETPFTMECATAPVPDDIYWKNVGLDHKKLQLGELLSFGLTALVCVFWTIPVAFIVTLTEVDGLTALLPFLESVFDAFPALGDILPLMAPLVLIVVKSLLPIILEYFTTLEGPISSSVVEASLFQKLALFEIIQTFFVSTFSGSIVSELAAIIEEPTSIITSLATSLPGQSSYFMQILFVQTFLGQGLELLRVVPLAKALIRSKVGPNLTEKERNATWFVLQPLADPLDFEYADIVSNGILYFMVTFVYGTMAPITNFFLALCFSLMISGYSHQLMFNYPSTPDSGGLLWIKFFAISQVCMLIAEFALLGLLALKQSVYALPFMVPLVVTTVLFNRYISKRHFIVAERLPARVSLKHDLKNQEFGPLDMSFAKGAYIQPSLQTKEDVYPENYGVAREIEQQNLRFMTPPGSEADEEETKEIDGMMKKWFG